MKTKTKVVIELEIECDADDAAHAEETIDRLLDEGVIQDLINHGPGEWSDECPGLLITNANCRTVD